MKVYIRTFSQIAALCALVFLVYQQPRHLGASELDNTSTEREHESNQLGRSDYINRLSTNDPLGSHAKLVLIVGYMRGGTSLVHEIFNHDKRSIAWYEPLSSLYGRLYGLPYQRIHTSIIYDEPTTNLRNLTGWEVDHVTQFFKAMFTCNLTGLPAELLSTPFVRHTARLKKYNGCFLHTGKPNEEYLYESTCSVRSNLSEFCSTNTGGRRFSVTSSVINHCDEYMEVSRSISSLSLTTMTPAELIEVIKVKTGLDISLNHSQSLLEHRRCMNAVASKTDHCAKVTHFTETCERSRIRTAKVLRIKMAFLMPILRALPNLHVIHYIRNPFAIAFSRTRDSNNNSESRTQWWLKISKRLCSEMWQDVQAAGAISTAFPDNYHRIRYEDLIRQPNTTLNRLYKVFNEVPTPAVIKWLHTTMHAADGDNGAFSVRRANASAHIDKWISAVPRKSLSEAVYSTECRDILPILGYIY